MASRAGEVRLDWGGMDQRLFRFGVGELRKLQEEPGVDAGPAGIAARCMVTLATLEAIRQSDFDLLARLTTGKMAELVHVRAVFRHGLLGARELSAAEVDKLVRDYVDDRPLGESLGACYQLCMGAILGPGDEPVGEGVGEAAASPSPTESSASPTTTEPGPSSV